MKKLYLTNLLISLSLATSILASGCVHTYTISVTDENGPVPNAMYRWNLVRKCRTSLGGEGKTDEFGYATFKSYPNAYVYVIREDKWGFQELRKDASSYLIHLKKTDVHPMDLAAKTVLGIEVSPEELPERGDY